MEKMIIDNEIKQTKQRSLKNKIEEGIKTKKII